MALIIKSRVVNDVVVLDLAGRLWILDLPLGDKINELLKEGHRHFVLSIAGVEYVDSSGLGQMVSIWSSIRNKDGHMTILNPMKRVQRLFDITKLDRIFEIFEYEADAIKQAQKDIRTGGHEVK